MDKNKIDKKILSNKALFWDVKITPGDIGKYEKFIIERILEKGDVGDYLWAVEKFGIKKIRDAVKHGKNLNKKSLNYWCLIHKIDKKKCIQNQSIEKQSLFSRR